MGRSVAIAPNAEFVVYASFEYNPEAESYEIEEEWGYYVEDVIEGLEGAFPSVSNCWADNEWVGRECRLIAKNNFGKFYISEYCGLVSISFVIDDLCDNVYYGEPDTTGLAEYWSVGAEAKVEKIFGENALVRIGGFSDGTSVYERVGV